MTGGVSFTQTTYNKPKPIDGSEQQVKSADIGNILATGQVEPQNETAPVNNTQPFPVQSNAETIPTTTKTIHGYTTEKIKIFIKDAGICNDINLDNISDEELEQKVNDTINNAQKECEKICIKFNIDPNSRPIKKFFDNDFKSIIIESGLYVENIVKAFADVLELESKVGTAEDINRLVNLLPSKILCRSAMLNAQCSDVHGDNGDFTKVNNKGLKASIGLNEDEELTEEDIYEYLNKIKAKYEGEYAGQEGSEILVKEALKGEIARLLYFSTKDEKKILLPILIKLTKENNEDGNAWSCLTQDSVLNIYFADCANFRARTELTRAFGIEDWMNLSPESREKISQEIDTWEQKIKDEYNGLTFSRINEILNELTENALTINDIDQLNLSEDELRFFKDGTYESFKQALDNIGIGGAVTGDERILGSANSVASGVGESFYREWLTGINTWLGENGNQFDLEYIQNILNNATNGNYGIVVEDILRGDGVHTPLNMPGTIQGGDSSSNGAYGDGYSSTGLYTGESSAQDPSTGFFNVPSQTTFIQAQTNLAQSYERVMGKSVKLSQKNTPKLVKPAQNIESAIQSGESYDEIVKTQVKENGVTGFVMDVFNSKVAMKCTYFKEKALNYFENMGTGIKKLTFEGIHNTSNAIMAARRLSFTELCEVDAQNIYVQENIKEIKEDKKKQEKEV